MVNYQVSWTDRVDLLRVTAKALNGISHRSKIHESRNSTEHTENQTNSRRKSFSRFYVMSMSYNHTSKEKLNTKTFVFKKFQPSNAMKKHQQ